MREVATNECWAARATSELGSGYAFCPKWLYRESNLGPQDTMGRLR